MKAKFYTIFFLNIIAVHVIYAQANQWTWMSGDSIGNAMAIYGTKGVASPLNNPGSRIGSAYWIDKAGNFWLFGGQGGDPNTGYGWVFNDLWKYDITINQWVWMSGDTIFYGNGYIGEPGKFSPANKPGCRVGSSAWTDASGNLWLFGGTGKGSRTFDGTFNDLWKYDITINQWAWIRGDSAPGHAGFYNSLGHPSRTNDPGARDNGYSWTDSSGNFWLFGGNGRGVRQTIGALSDLWKYSPSLNLWTWVNGDSIPNRGTVWGTKGVAAKTNNPGNRQGGTSWIDNKGKFWLFGGGSLSNALWQYNPSSNMWTWISGDYKSNEPGIYGIKGVPSPGNKPGARVLPVGWTDKSGNLWLFGGQANDPVTGVQGYLNDLWKYNISSNEWTWISGSNLTDTIGRYGTRGVASPENIPGSRVICATWIDLQENLWFFGGFGYSSVISVEHLNDLWKYTPAKVLPIHLINFTGSLKPGSVLLDWNVENEINFDHYEVEKSIDGRAFEKVGSVKANNQKEYDYADFLKGESTLTGLLYYRLKLIDKDARFTYSKVISIKISSKPAFTIYPNPSTTYIQLQLNDNISGKVEIEITDVVGKSIKQVVNGSNIVRFSRGNLPAGVYFIKATWNNHTTTGTVVLK